MPYQLCIGKWLKTPVSSELDPPLRGNHSGANVSMKSIGILGLAVVVVGAFLFATVNLFTELENQRENQLKFVTQIGEIKRLDEVLTMSSRMAAAGGGGGGGRDG